jgi:cytochrome c oxidase subunit III
MSRPELDVSKLPNHAFGHQGLIWWGTTGFMVIEGTMFVVTIMALLVLRVRNEAWPPGAPNPDLGPATINTLILLASAVPNHLAKKAAEQMDLGKVRPWLLVTIAFGVLFLIVRAFEFPALNVRWNEDAYSSIVWFLLGLHTTHVATDVVDSAVLAVLTYTHEIGPKRFVDLSENALYWDFIILSWIPIYVLVDWFPRWS